jgi:diguanylate cyclase (GGDEF)-like protein
MAGVLGWLDRRSSEQILVLALVLTALIGAVQSLVGVALSFHVFYLAPVSMVSWHIGRRAGMGISALAAIVWLTAEVVRSPAVPPAAYWNLAVRFASFMVVASIISTLRRLLEVERASARTDPLTGAHNTRAFAETTERELRRLRRFGRELTLAYVDLDDFKLVNDRHGHAVGDEVLRVVVSTIADTLRIDDVVARIGGDEFAVLLPETGAEASWVVLRKMHNAVRLAVAERGWPVGVSIGAITCVSAPQSAAALLALADDAMYAAKAQGKNTIEHRLYAPLSEPVDAAPS